MWVVAFGIEVILESFGFWYAVAKGPYFDDLSTWSKAQGAGALMACPNPLLLV